MSKFKPYPAYKDSGVEWLGEVPKHWEVGSFRHLIKSISNGTTIDQVDESDTTLAVSRIESISTGEINFEKVGHIQKQDAITRFLLNPGDILFSHINSLSMIGNVAIYQDNRPLIHGMNLLRIQPLPKTSSKLILYWLKSKNIRQEVESRAKPAINQASISTDSVKSLPALIPPLPEQTQIARFLDHETARIDALIEEQQRLIELLKEKRQAVISHAVTKGLDPTVPMKDSGVEWLGEVPAHWEVKQSKYLFEFVTSGSRGWAEFYSDEGDIFFRIANLTRDSIEPKLTSIQHVTPPTNAEGERSKVKAGDILISITADLGSVCIANDKITGSYVSQHIALARPNKNIVYSRWLAYFVLSSTCNIQLTGAGYGGTKIQLSLDDTRSFWVSIPSYEEQVLIAAFLDKEILVFDRLILQAAIGVELLQERRSALISAAVTGKIDVRGWQPPESFSTREQTPERVEEAV